MSLLVSGANLYCYCHWGNRTTSDYTKITRILFEWNWNEQPVELQKFIKIMIGNAQRPHFYHGSRLFHLNLETYLKVRTSFFNVGYIFEKYLKIIGNSIIFCIFQLLKTVIRDFALTENFTWKRRVSNAKLLLSKKKIIVRKNSWIFLGPLLFNIVVNDTIFYFPRKKDNRFAWTDEKIGHFKRRMLCFLVFKTATRLLKGTCRVIHSLALSTFTPKILMNILKRAFKIELHLHLLVVAFSHFKHWAT